MIARKRSREIRLAESQKVQEKVHQVLYCDTDWDEHEIYGRRFRKIVVRSKLDELLIEVDENVVKEYRAKIQRKLKGLDLLDKSLVFYRILELLMDATKNQETIVNELHNNTIESIQLNLAYLEKSGMVERVGENYQISSTIKKLLSNIQ